MIMHLLTAIKIICLVVTLSAFSNSSLEKALLTETYLNFLNVSLFHLESISNVLKNKAYMPKERGYSAFMHSFPFTEKTSRNSASIQAVKTQLYQEVTSQTATP